MRIGQKFVYKNHVHEIIDITEGHFNGEITTLIFHVKNMGEHNKIIKVKTLAEFIRKFGEM